MTGIVVTHVLNHVRRLVARLDALVAPFGIEVAAEVRQPMRVEHQGCIARGSHARRPSSLSDPTAAARGAFIGPSCPEMSRDGTCVVLAAMTRAANATSLDFETHLF